MFQPGEGHIVVAAADGFVNKFAFIVAAGRPRIGGGDIAVDGGLVLRVPAELDVGLQAFGDDVGEVLGQREGRLCHVVLDGAVAEAVQQVPRVVALVGKGQGAVFVDGDYSHGRSVQRARIDFVAVVARRIGVRELVREAQADGCGLADVYVHVRAETELVEAHSRVVAVLVGVEDTVFEVVVAAHVVTEGLGSSGHAEVGPAAGALLLEDGVDPVHGGVEFPVGSAQVHLPVVVADGGFGSGGGVQTVVVVYPLLGACQFGKFGGRNHTRFSLEVDLGLGLGTALGGDEDDTVRAAHTVQGGGGSVLEDAERSDVFRIHEVHVALHAVHQHERLFVRVLSEGVHTADPEVCACARLTGALHDHYTRQFTGKSG